MITSSLCGCISLDTRNTHNDWIANQRNLMPPTTSASVTIKGPVLYSTNTWIAYMIAQRYYGGIHYVWCTPYFDPRQLGRENAVPPTSSPLEMYRTLFEETSRGDRHSSKIAENRVGILHGASEKHAAKIITEVQKDEIAAVMKVALPTDFRPLLYVIPVSMVADTVREPPVEDKAHPLSAEYIIGELPRDCFDVIEFGGRT